MRSKGDNVVGGNWMNYNSDYSVWLDRMKEEFYRLQRKRKAERMIKKEQLKYIEEFEKSASIDGFDDELFEI